MPGRDSLARPGKPDGRGDGKLPINPSSSPSATGARPLRPTTSDAGNTVTETGLRNGAHTKRFPQYPLR